MSKFLYVLFLLISMTTLAYTKPVFHASINSPAYKDAMKEYNQGNKSAKLGYQTTKTPGHYGLPGLSTQENAANHYQRAADHMLTAATKFRLMMANDPDLKQHYQLKVKEAASRGAYYQSMANYYHGLTKQKPAPKPASTSH